MEIRPLLFIGVLMGSSTAAADRAVEGVHYDLGLNATYIESEFDPGPFYDEIDSSQIGVLLRGAVVVPIGQHFGVFLRAEVGKYEGEEQVNDRQTGEIEAESWEGSVGLLYRNPTIGKVSAEYARSRSKFDVTSDAYGFQFSDEWTVNHYSYSTAIEGYLGPVTMSVAGGRDYNLDEEDEEPGESVFAILRWYASSDVRLGLQAGFADAENVYGADIEFQPAFLGQSTGIFVAYLTNRANSDYKSNLVQLGVNFYFNNRFDLLTRDRHYR